MNGIVWKINRMRAMSVKELVHRLFCFYKTFIENYGFRLAKASKPKTNYNFTIKLDRKNISKELYGEVACKILSGNYSIFSLDCCYLGFPPDWHKDPLTGILSPTSFGKKIDYRNESLVGNIKYVWELNRHLELVTLAQAYYLTEDLKYAKGCKTYLESWLDVCVYPFGPNWTSSLENSIRLVNWGFSWILLGGSNSSIFNDEKGKSLKDKWLLSIYQHCYFIAGNLSKYSSANNHLLGEYMGLFIASIIWPFWPESIEWKKIAKIGFEEEVLKQNAPDGTNKEQGIWYQHEVGDMMLLCGLLGKINGIEFAPDFWKRLETMIGFIAGMYDVGSNVPMFGDSDDAVMVRFSPVKGFNVYRSLLASGAVLFNRTDFAAKAGVYDDKNRWLFGTDGEKKFFDLLDASSNQKTKANNTFKDGGYWILGKNIDTDHEVKLIVDAGSLGYLSIAAHGHADALAIYLTVGGNEILIDPGTFAYHTERKWRDYFRGTSSHNTLRVDGVDQSVSCGNFMWLKHANAWCERFNSEEHLEIFVGAHDGYSRLEDPLIHMRTIEIDKDLDQIKVVDSLQCSKGHRAELFWHFAEKCKVNIKDRIVMVRNGHVLLTFAMPELQWTPKVIMGDESLPLGWISRRFDYKEPTNTVVWVGEIQGRSELKTIIKYFIGK